MRLRNCVLSSTNSPLYHSLNVISVPKEGRAEHRRGEKLTHHLARSYGGKRLVVPLVHVSGKVIGKVFRMICE
jgi:hypothetical protein